MLNAGCPAGSKAQPMFGWRKRIGYIGPTVMEVMPYEFYRFAPMASA
jgi:hypothetical protein